MRSSHQSTPIPEALRLSWLLAEPVALRFQIVQAEQAGATATTGTALAPQGFADPGDPSFSTAGSQDPEPVATTLTRLMQRDRPSIFELDAPAPIEAEVITEIVDTGHDSGLLEPTTKDTRIHTDALQLGLARRSDCIRAIRSRS